MLAAGVSDIAEIERMFATFDVNHDNTISLEEKQAALQALANGVAAAALEVADANKDGVISKTEFFDGSIYQLQLDFGA